MQELGVGINATLGSLITTSGQEGGIDIQGFYEFTEESPP